MTKTLTIKRLLLLLLILTAGLCKSWTMNRTVPFANQNRISNNGAGVFTTANNAGNQYALALADLSAIPGIGTVGVVRIQFDSNIPSGSRWMIGIGDKNVRGNNANGSNKTSYNTDGLVMRFGTGDGTYYRMNGNAANNGAFGVTVHTDITFNRIAGTYTYTLTNGGTTFFSETGVSTAVENTTVIEAYSWLNYAQITLSNVTVQFDDFYFPDAGGTKYIEDIVYTNVLVNNSYSNVSYSQSNDSYWRVDGSSVYFKKTTGSEPSNLIEGDPITVTASATGVESTRFRVRIKTRNELDPNSMVIAATNTFDAGSTLGMFTSQVVNMEGMTLYLGYQGHTPVVRFVNGDYGLTIIDSNGYTFGNYAENHEWGTVYKIATTQAKTLTVSGYFAANSSNALQLYDGLNNAINGKSFSNPGDGSLVTATFALEANQTYLLYVKNSVFALKSLSYRDAYFDQAYAITTIGSAYQQTVQNMESPVYSIVDKQGDIANTSVTINSSTGVISGITAGGALKIQATGGGKTCIYYLTVAYPATDYPGHLWNFCTDVDANGNEISRRLDISDNLKTAPTPVASITDSYGEEWRFEYKNSNSGVERDPRWYRVKAVDGDNAFIVKETNGLVFVTGGRDFYLRNDAAEFTHIGIRGLGIGASFTIPALTAGDIVEIMWRHDSSGSGSVFTATNVTDLRGKDVDEEFLITESARRGNSNIRFVGYYSFIAKGGDVTFTLKDAGNCDIQSIRIYKGPYRTTMREIELSGNMPAPTTMLLDNVQQTNIYNYCNQLYSTATGPAMYVLKGYRKNNGGTLGVDYDHTGCVTGSNASKTPEFFTDEDAYPVSDAEKTQLYELRKNIVGLEMYNDTWQSARNSYNNGVIKATSGWGKVTIRMNNYTNDMKYVIGYTPDYTLTIGSAPHQTYPYTWDFTCISAQEERGKSTNVYNTIKDKDQYVTNWTNTQNGVFSLNINNSGEFDSQYVPGAVLVTTDRALSKITGVTSAPGDKYALDEFDGLGFSGKISFDSDSKTPSSARREVRKRASSTISLLSFSMDNYKVVNTTEEFDGETIVTDWKNAVGTYLAAGNGWVKFGKNKIVETNIAVCGFAYKCDLSAAANGDGVYLRPARSLLAGDVITIKVYATSSPSDSNPFGMGLYAENGTTAYVTQFIPNGVKNTETELTFIVPESMRGMSTICLYRESNSVYLTEVQITGSASSEPVRRELFCETETTITIPDLNNGKQDWLYVSATDAPTTVVNATLVTGGSDGADANDDVYKYKVTATGNAYLTFPMNTRIYKIGVTHILKVIHPVGGTGWATEIRKHSIDHELTGYFTKNDVNAYTVKYDSYDMETATVALTPIQEDGYVPEKTGIVMKLDNTGGLSDANAGKNVPLFYPSYTRPATTTLVDFPTNNMMYQDENGIESDNRNYNETYNVESINYTKFILTNKYWTFDKDHALSTDEGATQHTADVAGFYRMHIWKTGDVETRNTMPAHTAYLLVPSDNLPAAVWTLQSGYSAARESTLGVYNIIDPNSVTAIDQQQVIALDVKTSPIYTLDGRRLTAPPSKPGVYIIGGKKVIVR